MLTSVVTQYINGMVKVQPLGAGGFYKGPMAIKKGLVDQPMDLGYTVYWYIGVYRYIIYHFWTNPYRLPISLELSTFFWRLQICCFIPTFVHEFSTFGWLNFSVHPHHFKSQFYLFKSPLVAAWSLFSRANRVAPTFCRWWFWTLHLPQFLPKPIIWGVRSNPFVGYYNIYNHYYCRLLYICTNSYIYI